MLANGSVGSSSQKQKNKFGLGSTFGTVKNLFSTKYLAKPIGLQGHEKKKKTRRAVVDGKMDYRKKPNYADRAYQEAVSRLKYFLMENYTPSKKTYIREVDSAGEETDNQSLISGESRATFNHYTMPYIRYSPVNTRPYFYTTPRSVTNVLGSGDVNKNIITDFKVRRNENIIPTEILKFINKQEEYIHQLEKETRFCKDELSELIQKVKLAVPENSKYNEKHTSSFSFLDHGETETETELELTKSPIPTTTASTRKITTLEGPSIVFESRISELEAQLTQTKIELRKANEENESLRRKNIDEALLGNDGENLRKQLEALQREKILLQESVAKLQYALSHLKDKEFDATDQMKRSMSAAEHAYFEKNAAEQEIRRLRDDLERQHAKLRELMSEQTRRVADERNTVERRYSQQIDQLTAELGVQWESANKLQLELDKQRRENADLRREITQKNAYIDELKKEMQNKIASLQSEFAVSGAEKGALEEQVSGLQLSNERNERHLKQEINRLQAEMQSLRQRLDRADADLIHSRRENLRLKEQIASLEKEINLTAALSEEKKNNEIVALPSPTSKSEVRNKEVASMVKEMEDKHAVTVAELESMIHSQNQLMEKLSNECHVLTGKLEDNSTRHMKEIRQLQNSLNFLTNRLCQNEFNKGKMFDTESTSAKAQLSVQENANPAHNPETENEINNTENETSATINYAHPEQQILNEDLNQSDHNFENLDENTYSDNKQLEDLNKRSPEDTILINKSNDNSKPEYNTEYDTQPTNSVGNGQEPNEEYVEEKNQPFLTGQITNKEEHNMMQYNDDMNQHYLNPNEQYFEGSNPQEYTNYNQHYPIDPDHQQYLDENDENLYHDEQYAVDNPEGQYIPEQKYTEEYHQDLSNNYTGADEQQDRHYVEDPKQQCLPEENQYYQEENTDYKDSPEKEHHQTYN